MSKKEQSHLDFEVKNVLRKKQIKRRRSKASREKKHARVMMTQNVFSVTLYSESNEGWIECEECHCWAHPSCAGVDADEVAYVCAICKD